MSSDGVQWDEQLIRLDVEVSTLEWGLWILVALAMIGDVVTTFVGLHAGLAESNPVARGVIDGYGVVGMLALKTGAILVGVGCRTVLTREYGPIVPAGLAVPWVLAVLINLYTIAQVV